jgi:small subunit ribosomal protein S21
MSVQIIINMLKPYEWPLKRAVGHVFGGRENLVSEVHLKDNESLDSALKRFKRNCAKAGVLSDLRKKEYYQSPSVKRRKKSEAARKNKNKKFFS